MSGIGRDLSSPGGRQHHRARPQPVLLRARRAGLDRRPAQLALRCFGAGQRRATRPVEPRHFDAKRERCGLALDADRRCHRRRRSAYHLLALQRPEGPRPFRRGDDQARQSRLRRNPQPRRGPRHGRGGASPAGAGSGISALCPEPAHRDRLALRRPRRVGKLRRRGRAARRAAGALWRARSIERQRSHGVGLDRPQGRSLARALPFLVAAGRPRRKERGRSRAFRSLASARATCTSLRGAR